jgi:hypothetical protein
MHGLPIFHFVLRLAALLIALLVPLLLITFSLFLLFLIASFILIVFAISILLLLLGVGGLRLSANPTCSSVCLFGVWFVECCKARL